MATLNDIYRISGDISGLRSSIEQGVGMLDRLEKKSDALMASFTKIRSVVAGAFSTAAIVAAGRAAVDYAGHLTDLHQQTDISTTGLQKMELAFRDNGIQIDTVAMASVKLAKNLISGDQSAVGALKKLGLSVADLKRMAPEDQFFEVADAIGKIPNPTEKAYASVAVFGKGGAELLAGLTGHLRETAAAFEALGLIIDEKTIAAADDFGDRLGHLQKAGTVFIAEILGPAVPGLAKLADWFTKLATGAVGLEQSILNGVVIALIKAELSVQKFALGVAETALKIPGLRTAMGVTTDTVDRLRRGVQETEDRLTLLNLPLAETGTIAKAHTAPALLGLGDDSEKMREKLAKLTAEVHKLEAGLFAFPDELQKIGRAYDETKLGPLVDDIAKVERTAHIANFGFQGMTDGLGDVGRAVVATESELHDFAEFDFAGPVERKFRSLADYLQHDFGKVILGAFQGGGDVGKSIGGGIGGFLLSEDSSIGNSLGGFLQKHLGKLGAAIGSILPGLGTLIGGGLGSLIGKLFSNPEKQINPIRQAFVDAAGGLEVLNQKAHDAGATLNALLDARTPEAYKRAIDDLNKAFKFQDDAMVLLDKTVEKYGFEIQQLGPKFAAQKLNDQAGELLQDYSVLTAAGVFHNEILSHMAPNVQAYVDKVQEAGLTIPEGMRPMLQAFVDAGLLTDKAGLKMTNLSSLKFSETLDTKFQTLIDTIKELTDAISRGLGTALVDLGNTKVSPIHVPITFDTPSGDIPQFAEGGPIKRTGLIFAHEGEYVLPAGAAFRGSDGGVVHTHVYLDGREIATAVTRQQDDALRLRRKLAAA